MMTITPAAEMRIREALRRSEIPAPVVALLTTRAFPKEVQQALNRGRSQKDVQHILSEVGPSRWYLYPCIYPRSHFLWLATKINGIPFSPLFAHPSRVRRAMRNGLLDIADRGLVLKDADGTDVTPIND